MIEQRVDDFLVAVHDVEHARREAASWNRSQISIDVEGSRSDGFRMNVFPQATATGYIHIGTMAGKLNGVMPATTPSGWRSEYASMSGPILRAELALQKLRDAAGEIHDLDAAGQLAERIRMRLAVLAARSRARSRRRSSPEAP